MTRIHCWLPTQLSASCFLTASASLGGTADRFARGVSVHFCMRLLMSLAFEFRAASNSANLARLASLRRSRFNRAALWAMARGSNDGCWRGERVVAVASSRATAALVWFRVVEASTFLSTAAEKRAMTSKNLSPLHSSSIVLRRTASRPSTPFFFRSFRHRYRAARRFSDCSGSSGGKKGRSFCRGQSAAQPWRVGSHAPGPSRGGPRSRRGGTGPTRRR